MKIERLRLKGFSPAFPGAVDLEVGSIGSGLVAIAGGNGAGKTTLLESIPGAIYRQMPSNDGADPVTYATERTSYLDHVFTFDQVGTFRARVNLDGPKRQSDALLEQISTAGSLPLNDGKRSTYDEAIRTRFPSFDLFVNSSFAAQGRGDEFTRRKPSQRKDLFAEFLGQQRYAEMARSAVGAASIAEAAHIRLSSRVDVLERETGPLVVEELERRAAALLQASVLEQEKRDALAPRFVELEDRLALLADQVSANAAADQRVRQHQNELARRNDDVVVLNQQHANAADAYEAENVKIWATTEAKIAAVASKIHDNTQIQEQGPAIRKAVEQTRKLEGQLVHARDRQAATAESWNVITLGLASAEHAVQKYTKPTLELERARTDAGLLAKVPCHGAGEYAACQLLVNATAAAARVLELEALVAGMTDAIRARDLALERREFVIETTREASARVKLLEGEIAKHQAVAKYERALAESTVRVEHLEQERIQYQREGELAAADARDRLAVRLAELDAQVDQARERVDAVAVELARAIADSEATRSGNAAAAALALELAGARKAHLDAATAAAKATSARDYVLANLQDIAQRATELEVLRARRIAVAYERMEWLRLVEAFSKGGLPDLEIDAAGPTISAMANHLLLSCFGARFSIELVTQVAKADGGGMKDNFTVLVTDNDAAAPARDIRAFSGGERTILQEALMCAIAIYVNDRAAMPIRTLWRDETGAALDPVNAIRYVEMLRKVLELGGFHQVFYISHNPNAAALADAQIQVGDGEARIVLPPYEATQ